MIETVLVGIVSFAGTNIDDIFIDTLLFSEAKSKADRRDIFIGKYLGIGFLVLVSIFAGLGLQLLAGRYIGFLGVVPVFLGIREAVSAFRGEEEEERKGGLSGFLLRTAVITAANGADNIGVYTPLFAGYGGWQTAVTVGVFLLLTGVWCRAGEMISALPAVERSLERHKKWIVPAVYILLGGYILLENFL